MITGKMVVMHNGDLATAMRASMAIPGAFAPVVTEQYILSDGGMVRTSRSTWRADLCADVVIVVNLVEPSREPRHAAVGHATAQPQHGRDARGQRDLPLQT
jgi:NTE family protein